MRHCGWGFRQDFRIKGNRRHKCPPILLSFLLLCLSVQAETTLKIDGSTGVKPLVQALVTAYQQEKDSFEVKIGSGLKPQARVDALLNQQIDIAMASHGIDIQQISRHGLQVYRFAKMAVVIAVNQNVAINDISHQQLCAIYSGSLSNWQELGGKPGSIKALIRPFTEVDAEVFKQKIPCFADLTLSDSVAMINKSGPMARTIANTPGVIGMTTMVRVAQNHGKMRAIAINGIAPEVQNLVSGEYAYSRDSFLITATRPSREVSDFLAFINSEQGASIIVQNNAVPAN